MRATDLLIADEKTGTGSAAAGRRPRVHVGYGQQLHRVVRRRDGRPEEHDGHVRGREGRAGAGTRRRRRPRAAGDRRLAESSRARGLDPAGAPAAGRLRRARRGQHRRTEGRPGHASVPRRTDGRQSQQAEAWNRAANDLRPGRPTFPWQSRTERFERASVLTPQVVSFFVERLNVGGRGEPNPEPVIEHARAGRFDDAVQSLSTPGTSVSAAFLTGLALYSKGELEPAAARFREALRLDSEFFPAAFYLGSCYAAGGRDQEAVGAWQLALVTESDAPFIYTLLGDALLRLREVDQALEILNDAAAQWPENEEVQVRIGAALAMAGKRADALRQARDLSGQASRRPRAPLRRAAHCSTRRGRTASRSDRRTRTGRSSRSGLPPTPPPKARSWRSSSNGRRPWLSS